MLETIRREQYPWDGNNTRNVFINVFRKDTPTAHITIKKDDSGHSRGTAKTLCSTEQKWFQSEKRNLIISTQYREWRQPLPI